MSVPSQSRDTSKNTDRRIVSPSCSDLFESRNIPGVAYPLDQLHRRYNHDHRCSC